jgi:parallel beta-helix repeat protein
MKNPCTQNTIVQMQTSSTSYPLKGLTSLLASLLFIVINSSSAFSQILNVPGDYTSIQQAIEATQKGDTVLVDEGRYFENINFRGKSIVVASKYLTTNDTSFITKTIIDGSKPVYPDSASCAMLISSEDSGAVLAGFTITKGKGTIIEGYVEGGGVLMNKSTATIRNNIITGNSVSAGGGAIASWRGKPRILNNLIINNYGEYAAGLVLNWSDGIIKNNIIYHNVKTGSKWLTGGLMIWDSPGNPIIENNTIIGNFSTTEAGGISITTKSNPVLINNIVWGNRQLSGKQISGAKANSITYCNLETSFAGEGNINSFPFFEPNGLSLVDGSPCIDAGSSLPIYNDLEKNVTDGQALFPSLGTIRNDMGAFGGQGATILNSFKAEDIYVSKKTVAFGIVNIGDTKKMSVEIFNPGTSELTIDSLVFSDSSVKINLAKGLTKLNRLENDTIIFEWKPITTGNFSDTLKIYHSVKTVENPLNIIITGKGNLTASSNQIPNGESEMLQISPNPCSNQCKIKYRIVKDSPVNLTLYNLMGEKVEVLINSQKKAGDHQIEFNRKKMKRGVYIFKFVSEGVAFNKKIVMN